MVRLVTEPAHQTIQVAFIQHMLQILVQDALLAHIQDPIQILPNEFVAVINQKVALNIK